VVSEVDDVAVVSVDSLGGRVRDGVGEGLSDWGHTLEVSSGGVNIEWSGGVVVLGSSGEDSEGIS